MNHMNESANPSIGADVLRRARAFADDRAAAQYWADVRRWASQDDGDVPEWLRYEPTLWQELLLLCEGLGELAAIDPQVIFPSTDPWSDEYGGG